MQRNGGSYFAKYRKGDSEYNFELDNSLRLVGKQIQTKTRIINGDGAFRIQENQPGAYYQTKSFTTGGPLSKDSLTYSTQQGNLNTVTYTNSLPAQSQTFVIKSEKGSGPSEDNSMLIKGVNTDRIITKEYIQTGATSNPTSSQIISGGASNEVKRVITSGTTTSKITTTTVPKTVTIKSNIATPSYIMSTNIKNSNQNYGKNIIVVDGEKERQEAMRIKAEQ